MCAATWIVGATAHAQTDEDPPPDGAPPESLRVPGGVPDAPVPPGEIPEPSVDVWEVLRGEGTELDADEAARLALASAPSLDGAREVVAQVRAGADRALYGFIPALDVAASYIRLPTDGGRLVPDDISQQIDVVSDPAARALWDRHATVLEDRFAVSGTLTLPVSDYLFEVWPRYEAAQGQAEAQEHTLRATAHGVALAAREAFYQYVRARGALAVSQTALRQAETRNRVVAAQLRVGHASPADELQLRAQTAATRVALARAEAGVNIAATALRTMLHVDPDTAIAVAEDLNGELPEPPGAREALITRAIEQRPETRALRTLIAARGWAVDAAEGSRYPNLVVTGRAEVGSPNDRLFIQTRDPQVTGYVGAALTWSLAETLAGERLADEARAEQGRARADLRALEDAIRNQVTEALASYEGARLALEAARLSLEAADEAHRVRMAQLRRGQALSSQLVDAGAAQVRAQLEVVNAAIDARVALTRLRHAVGEDVDAAR